MNQPARRSLTVVTVMLLASFSAAMSPMVAAENSETLENQHSSDPYVIFEASQHNNWHGSALHFETHFGNDGEINDEDGNVWMNYAITQDIDDDGDQDYLAFMWSYTTPLDWHNATFHKHDWYQTYVDNLESANPVTIKGEWGSWYCLDSEYSLDGTYKYTEEDCHEDDGVNAGPYGSWEPYTEESFSFEYTLDAFVTADIDSALSLIHI